MADKAIKVVKILNNIKSFMKKHISYGMNG